MTASTTAADIPLVELIRPSSWSGQGSSHPTYSIAIQPQYTTDSSNDSESTSNSITHPTTNGLTSPNSANSTTRRRRVATASGDKTFGVCIWDLDEVLGQAPSAIPAVAAASQSPSDSVGVKVESPAGGGSTRTRRGLLATLSNHLSAVNVVRWEPLFGHRLASGSDHNTQGIIIWKQKDVASTSESKEDSSTPFGLTRAHSGPTLPGEEDIDDEDEKAPPNREHWIPALSLHGQGDIQDLSWGPIGLHFHDDQDQPMTDTGVQSVLGPGLTMESTNIVAKRISMGLGSQVLASCSLDTSVVVWNTDTGDRHILKGHSGSVLGVSFDPLGSVLTTQSVDGFVWVWNVANFQLIRKIRSVGLPFTKAPRTDVYRTIAMARMSWTPDGAALVCCRGELPKKRKGTKVTSLQHVSVVLNRKRNFAAQCVFGGHTERTTVSAFSPILFKTTASSSATPSFFGILAIGSHDANLSIWSTRSPRPILLLTEVFSESILDLSWSEDGKTLLVSSHDGSICILNFTSYSVFEGVPATDADRSERLRTLYGTSGASVAPSHGLPSGPEALALQAEQLAFQAKLKALAEAEAQRREETRLAELDEGGWGAMPVRPKPPGPNFLPSPIKAGPTTAPDIRALQIEVKRADGKRRITPVAISAPAVQPPPAQPTRSTSSTAGRINIANASESVLLQLTAIPTSTTTTTTTATVSAAANAVPLDQGQPMDESTDLFAGTAASITAAAAAITAKRKRDEEEEKSKAQEESSTTNLAKKSKVDTTTGASHPPAPRVSRPKFALPPPPKSNRWMVALPSSADTNNEPIFLLPTPPTPSPPKPSQWELVISDSFGKPITPSSPTTQASQCTVLSAYSFAARSNAATNLGAPPPAVRHLVWESFLPYRVLLAKANSQILVMAANDTHTGLFYLVILSSSTGRMLFPAILLSSAPYAVSIHTRRSLDVVLVLTCDGLLRVYDLAIEGCKSKLVTQCTVRTMLTNLSATAHKSTTDVGSSSTASPVRITAVRLTDTNQPMIVLSNHQSFVYDTAFESWSLAPTRDETIPNSASTYLASEMKSILKLAERTAQLQNKWEENASTLNSALPTTAPHLPISLTQLSQIDARTRIMQTISHLESALASASYSNDSQQYRSALINYINKLVSLYPSHPSALVKLDALLHDLAGPVSFPSLTPSPQLQALLSPTTHPDAHALTDEGRNKQWQPNILGFSKRALLTSLLPLIHSNPTLLAQMPQWQQWKEQ